MPSVTAFFERAVELASQVEVGEQLVLLVPDEPFGTPVYMTTAGFPDEGLAGFDIRCDQIIDRGQGVRYVGTPNGIHVFIWHFKDAAFMCARSLLKNITFGEISGEDIFDFEISDKGDPTKSEIRYWIAPELEWGDGVCVEFRFPLKGTEDPSDGGPPKKPGQTRGRRNRSTRSRSA